MDYFISVVLLTFSALFSGLTLGLMGLNLHALRRKARLGNKKAIKVLPIRERGNHLLTTLLLGNVAVNTILAIYLGSIANGVVASIVATSLIFLLGEIIPQAVISRHALTFGAYSAPFVHGLMRITAPITYPIGALLDRLLGEELPTLYSKRELMEIISEHHDSAKSAIDGDEKRIVHGALKFSNKIVADVMTPLSKVVTIRDDQVLDKTLRRHLTEEGFSRYPVCSRDGSGIMGILYTKDVIIAEEKQTVSEVCEHRHLTARPTDTLDLTLAHMLARRLHMAIVRDELNVFLGVITLEDIIEEVIQQEILDEDDDTHHTPLPATNTVAELTR